MQDYFSTLLDEIEISSFKFACIKKHSGKEITAMEGNYEPLGDYYIYLLFTMLDYAGSSADNPTSPLANCATRFRRY
jgi:hypothetical protein